VRVRIAHLYPREMGLYGDSGNVVVLAKRLGWRGHAVNVVRIDPGSRTDLRRADLVVGGGGSDAAQRQVVPDLLSRKGQVGELLESGVPMLLVCGMFQLFGQSYIPADGCEIPGIGVFDAVSTSSRPRISGPITVQTPFGMVTGYENHSGVTRLAPTQQPFGHVVSGVGNGVGSGVEGALAGAAIGTYLHGPLLAANPGLADHLLLAAMLRLDPLAQLIPMDVPKWRGRTSPS
jgi:lipid II isoglutaminyl synthase (glutamine-hydrolysing)